MSIRLDDLGNKPATQHGTGPISDDLFAHKVAAGSPIYALFTDAAAAVRPSASLAEFAIGELDA